MTLQPKKLQWTSKIIKSSKTINEFKKKVKRWLKPTMRKLSQTISAIILPIQ